MNRRLRNGCRAVIMLSAALLAACAAGPDFHAPPPPRATAYTREPLAPVTASTRGAGGAAQTLRFGRDLPGDWWHLFGSAALDRLVRESIEHHPSIAAQQAALRAAREKLRAGGAVFLPSVQGNLGAEREQVSGASVAPGFPGFITNVFQATVGVSYTFDLFGGERRELERLRAKVDEERFVLESSYLTLTANVASTAVELASVNAQIAATREIVSLEQAQLDLIRRQYGIGIRTQADVLQQQSNLAGVRATLPALLQQRAAAQHALAALTGRLPQEAPPVEITLAALTLPANVPVSVPSALTAQRPDIRAQEALMRQASGAVGVATANLLPSLTLTGAFGGQSLESATLLGAGAGVWNVAGGLAAPLFEGGRLRAQRRAAVDAYQQAAALYRLTVLNAFQNVADSLTALGHDAEAVKAESDALAAAQASLDLIRRQYDVGAVTYVSLLSAQQTYQQARIAYIRTVAARYTDTIALFQSLGGGWWNRRT
ncbi:MAG TPA: efflux transporter outer membrane subunit [Steroidobacteraceae bacterium]|nr:efflux transporter outer membrane subunit [Steroidobacteraceae bacterium]